MEPTSGEAIPSGRGGLHLLHALSRIKANFRSGSLRCHLKPPE
jgi:hypothetical protein